MIMRRIDRPLPSNTELEFNVLGAIIFDADCDLGQHLRNLSADDFTTQATKALYKCISGLVKDGIAPDIMAISARNASLAEVAVKAVGSIATTANFNSWVSMLQILTVKRKALIASSEFLDAIYDSDNVNADIERMIEKLRICSTPLKGKYSVGAGDVNCSGFQEGWVSGYVTHDYNDSGLRPGCVTLVAGTKGHGKTAFVRQIPFALAMQKVKSYYFIGESTMSAEKMQSVKLLAQDGELDIHKNKAGKKLYLPTRPVIERYDKLVAPFVLLADVDMFEKGRIFDNMILEMANMAKIDVKVFVIDNLMILTEKGGNAKFDQQRHIAQTLKNFAKRYDVHVILVVHPNATGERISGVEEVANLVDTILWYRRLDFNKKLKDSVRPSNMFTDEEWEAITAIVEVDKIRDNGTRKPMFLRFEPMRGALHDVTDLPEAMNQLFCWSRHISRYAKTPDYDKQYSSK